MATTQTWEFAVKTDPTTNTGERRSRDEFLNLTAPEGYAYIRDSFKVVYHSQIGSEHEVTIDSETRTKFGIVTGVRLKAHARSRGGVAHRGERGSVSGVASIDLEKLTF